MNTRQHQQRMRSLYTMQAALFDRTFENILAEFKSVLCAVNFLRQAETLFTATKQQRAAFLEMLALAESLPKSATTDDANRSQAFIDVMHESNVGVALSNWFDARRKSDQAIWDMEINHVLGADVALREKAKANPEDKELREFSDSMSWRFGACQEQVHALCRQAEAMAELEQAMLRSHGLKIWQGRKQHLRWEGDDANRWQIAR